MANAYEPPKPDFRIDGFDAATERTEKNFFSAILSDDMFVMSFSTNFRVRTAYLLR